MCFYIQIAGGINRLIETEVVKRALMWDPCLLHANERTYIIYFLFCDNEGLSTDTTSPDFDGHIGKMFKKGLKLEPIIIREYNPFADCNFEKLPKDLYDALNHDYKLLHDLILATVSGDFPEELALRTIGHPHPARWVTPASNTIRVWHQTKEPTVWHTNLVKYTINVYWKVISTIKLHPHITNGSRHIFELFRLARDFFSDKEGFDLFKHSYFNNNYFNHIGKKLKKHDIF